MLNCSMLLRWHIPQKMCRGIHVKLSSPGASSDELLFDSLHFFFPLSAFPYSAVV